MCIAVCPVCGTPQSDCQNDECYVCGTSFSDENKITKGE